MVTLNVRHPMSLVDWQRLQTRLIQSPAAGVLHLQGAEQWSALLLNPLLAMSADDQRQWLAIRAACWQWLRQHRSWSLIIDGFWPELEWLTLGLAWQADERCCLAPIAPFWGLISSRALHQQYGALHPLASLQLQSGLALPVAQVRAMLVGDEPQDAQAHNLVAAPLRDRVRLWQQPSPWQASLVAALTQASQLALACGYWQAKRPMDHQQSSAQDTLLLQSLVDEGEPSRALSSFLYPSMVAVPVNLIQRMAGFDR